MISIVVSTLIDTPTMPNVIGLVVAMNWALEDWLAKIELLSMIIEEEPDLGTTTLDNLAVRVTEEEATTDETDVVADDEVLDTIDLTPTEMMLAEVTVVSDLVGDGLLLTVVVCNEA